MMPKCCEKCNHSTPEACSYHKSCYEWLEWFAKEWAGIRKAAKGIDFDPYAIKPEKLRQRKAKKTQDQTTAEPKQEQEPPRRRVSVCMPSEWKETEEG